MDLSAKLKTYLYNYDIGNCLSVCEKFQECLIVEKTLMLSVWDIRNRFFMHMPPFLVAGRPTHPAQPASAVVGSRLPADERRLETNERLNTRTGPISIGILLGLGTDNAYIFDFDQIRINITLVLTYLMNCSYFYVL